MQISILTVKQVAKPTKVPGKTTPALEVAYKNLSFNGKVEGRDIYSFGGNKGGYDRLVNAKPGEVYEVEVVKNAAGFNDWTMATKVEGDDIKPTQIVAAPAVSKGSGYTPSPKSTYPSDEERAKVQVYIVRQSNITAAINLLSVGAKKLDVEDVLKVARQFEDHVFGNSNEPMDVTKAFDDLDDFPDLPQ